MAIREITEFRPFEPPKRFPMIRGLRRLLLNIESEQRLSPEELEQIETHVKYVKEGGVLVVHFGTVLGYVCDATSQKAKDAIRDYKELNPNDPHTFALITIQELFQKIVRTPLVPPHLLKLIENGSVPEGIHFRIPAAEGIEIVTGEQSVHVPLPADCFSVPQTLPDGTQNTEAIPFIQPVIFDQTFTKLSYFLARLAEKGSPYIVATSANIHGISELETLKAGKSIARKNKLPFFDVRKNPRRGLPHGSYPGIEAYSPELGDPVLQGFRHGHSHPDHLRSQLELSTFGMKSDSKPPTVEYAITDTRLWKVLAALPPIYRLPLLHWVNERVKKAKDPIHTQDRLANDLEMYFDRDNKRAE